MPANPKIVILSEQLRGQAVELTEEQYLIGRVEECDICIPDPTVSTRHCVLNRKDEGGYEVVDQGSTNGTRVNGQRLEPEQPRVLVNSDILQVGGVEILFDHEDSRVAAGSTTQTVIDLENTKTGELPVPAMTNFSPFGPRGGSRQQNKRVAMVLGVFIGVLGVLVLGAILYMLFKLVGSG